MCLGNAGKGCTSLIGSNNTAIELDRKMLGHGGMIEEYNGCGIDVLKMGSVFSFIGKTGGGHGAGTFEKIVVLNWSYDPIQSYSISLSNTYCPRSVHLHRNRNLCIVKAY